MLADDLVVGNDRWRMTSLAVEPDGSVMMSVVPSAISAICPVCGTRSARRHTWYRRTALDLPWRKFTVRLRAWAWRFFCDEPTCRRKILCRVFTGNEPAVKLEPDSRELRVRPPGQIPCAGRSTAWSSLF